MALRACPHCGRIACRAHTPSLWAGSTRAWRKVRLAVLQRDCYTCRVRQCCSGALATHVDHITPKSKGGSDDMSNLRASCAECNLTRGSA